MGISIWKKIIMNNVPLVSIIIFTYNHSKFIRETIEGALAQTYESTEIVIADDCSTDGNIEIINQYAELYPNKIVPVIGNKNIGITGNANRGIAMCKGEYIAMVGGDDVIFATKLEKQMEWLLKSNNRALCGHALKICDSETNVTSDYNHRLPKKGFGRATWLEHGALFGATSIVVKTEYLPNPAFDPRIPIVSDWKLYIDLLKDDLEFGYVDEWLGLYRKHANNVTNNIKPAIDDLEVCINICLEQYPEHKSTIQLGYAYLVKYGFGNYYLSKNEFKLASSYFSDAIKLNPYNYKFYIKYILTKFKQIRQRN